MKYAHTWLVVAALAGTVLVTPAAADFIPGPTATVVTIRASAGGEIAESSWFFPDGLVVRNQEPWGFNTQTDGIALESRGKRLGVIRELDVQIDADPSVTVKFAVEAGAVDTTFTLTSALVTFDPIVNPIAYAAASVTVTDYDSNGAQLTGLFDGGAAYRAWYNDPNVTWAQLVGPVSADVDGTASFSQRQPVAGRTAVPATVNSIQSQFRFVLSANDAASGTSRFDVIEVPEPSALALLAAGAAGLLICVRRRRKA